MLYDAERHLSVIAKFLVLEYRNTRYRAATNVRFYLRLCAVVLTLKSLAVKVMVK